MVPIDWRSRFRSALRKCVSQEAATVAAIVAALAAVPAAIHATRGLLISEARDALPPSSDNGTDTLTHHLKKKDNYQKRKLLKLPPDKVLSFTNGDNVNVTENFSFLVRSVGLTDREGVKINIFGDDRTIFASSEAASLVIPQTGCTIILVSFRTPTAYFRINCEH